MNHLAVVRRILFHRRNAAAAVVASKRYSSSSRNGSDSPSETGGFLLERLTGRTLIRVHGAQSQEFLQSLVTNDMQHLHPSDGPPTDTTTAIFTMFLNKQGRVLYDALVYKPPATVDTYLIECDRDIADELQKHLKIFRVRKKIDIDLVSKELSVWAAFNPAASDNEQAPKTLNLNGEAASRLTLVIDDPRVKHLGTRIVAAHGMTADALLPTGTAVAACGPDDEAYRLHRYRLGIGEGVDELPVAKCFPLESNADYLHGVSFHKGCYLGQEFTARTHHTGVVRKRLLPVQFAANGTRLTAKSSRNVENTNGGQLGKVRGFVGDRGLALLKYEAALQEVAALEFGSNGDGVQGRVSRPLWWPQEAPSLTKP